MPDLKLSYEQSQIHSTWTEIYRSRRDDAFNDLVMKRVVALLKAESGSKFLDAGCGTGEHTRRILARGFACTAVDISEIAIAAARAGGTKADFVCEPLERLG